MDPKPNILSRIAETIQNNPLKATGTALVGTAMVRGRMHALDNKHEARDQIERMKHDSSTPVQKFAHAWNEKLLAITNRYQEFGEDKVREKTSASVAESFGNTAMKSFNDSIVKTLTNQLFTAPLNKGFDIIKKKLYLEPRQKNVLEQVIQSDPILAKAMQDTPEIITNTYKTLKQFAPSLTVDPVSVRNFLRQAVIVGGQFDFATIKLLAETEKNVQQSRGKIGAGG